MKSKRIRHYLAWCLVAPTSFFSLLAPALAADSLAALYARGEYLEVVRQGSASSVPADQKRYLGLSLFQLQRYAKAAPYLKTALAAEPGNARLRRALAQSLFENGEMPAALEVLQPLLTDGDIDAMILAGQIHLAQEEIAQARSLFERALRSTTDPHKLQQINLGLAPIYRTQGDRTVLTDIDSRMSEIDSGNPAVKDFADIVPQERTDRAVRPYQLAAGYRLEYDSNVGAFPDDSSSGGMPSDESDWRNVLFLDALGHIPLGQGFTLYGEAHLRGGVHVSESEYDYFDQTWVASLGWSSDQGYGFRLPVEYSHLNMDNDISRSRWAVSPGFVWDAGPDISAYFYARFESLDYDGLSSIPEDRSGDADRYGVSIVWTPNNGRTSVRGILEFGSDDTNGENWQRDVQHYYVRADHRLNEQWSIDGGIEYYDYDFDNEHDVFLTTRKDDFLSFFASLNYQLSRDWKLTLSGVNIKSGSNIELYDYDRYVISSGVTWQY